MMGIFYCLWCSKSGWNYWQFHWNVVDCTVQYQMDSIVHAGTGNERDKPWNSEARPLWTLTITSDLLHYLGHWHVSSDLRDMLTHVVSLAGHVGACCFFNRSSGAKSSSSLSFPWPTLNDDLHHSHRTKFVMRMDFASCGEQDQCGCWVGQRHGMHGELAVGCDQWIQTTAEQADKLTVLTECWMSRTWCSQQAHVGKGDMAMQWAVVNNVVSSEFTVGEVGGDTGLVLAIDKAGLVEGSDKTWHTMVCGYHPRPCGRLHGRRQAVPNGGGGGEKRYDGRCLNLVVDVGPSLSWVAALKDCRGCVKQIQYITNDNWFVSDVKGL